MKTILSLFIGLILSISINAQNLNPIVTVTPNGQANVVVNMGINPSVIYNCNPYGWPAGTTCYRIESVFTYYTPGADPLLTPVMPYLWVNTNPNFCVITPISTAFFFGILDTISYTTSSYIAGITIYMQYLFPNADGDFECSNMITINL